MGVAAAVQIKTVCNEDERQCSRCKGRKKAEEAEEAKDADNEEVEHSEK